MKITSKQDGVYPRTAAALAQQYDFGKVFDEITGIKLTVEEQEAMMKAELSLKLGYNDSGQIVSMLNASADIITIRGNRLTIDSTYFSLDADGTIYATAGEIGGCSIVNGVLRVPTANITGRLTADQIDTGSFTAKLDEIEERVGDAEDSITRTNTSLAVLSGEIESKVSQTTFDTLSGTVTQYDTRITENERQIALRVTETTFDALGNRVSKAESNITQLPGQIMQSVSETYATNDALKTGISSAESKITQTASAIRSEVAAKYATQDGLEAANSKITQTATEILSSVDETYQTKAGYATGVNNLNSKITQLSNEISAKVSYTEFNALGNEVASVQGELSLKIDADNLISTLNATADVISLNYNQLILNGEYVSFSDGVMHLLELYVGDGWNNHFCVNENGISLQSFSVYSRYDVMTGHETFLAVDNISCAYASVGGWTFGSNDATLTTPAGYLTIGIGGIIGTATGGTLLSWSRLKELAG